MFGLVIQHLNDCSRHSTLLKHVLLTQEQKHCIASRAVALDTARAVGGFYITTYIIHLGCMWE